MMATVKIMGTDNWMAMVTSFNLLLETPSHTIIMAQMKDAIGVFMLPELKNLDLN